MTKLMANGMADLFEYFCELDNSVHGGQDTKTFRYLMIFAKHYRDTTIFLQPKPLQYRCNMVYSTTHNKYIMDTTTENMAHLITGMDALGKGRDGN